ncbi:MAG: hypothetical protein HKN47_10800 [Pirellulaceae bacterium]|nr:hypothetical protein [Pirellulaceae bacterium]
MAFVSIPRTAVCSIFLVSCVICTDSLDAQQPVERIAAAHRLPPVDHTPKHRIERTTKASVDQTTHCVLLRNDNVLFGRAVQRGNEIIIQRGDGSELKLDRAEVLCWGESLHDLYRYRVDHRHHADPVTHLAEAQWCLRHDLLDAAAQELQQLYRIDPYNRSAARLERQLYQAIVAARKKPSAVAQAVHHQSATATESASRVALASHAQAVQDAASKADPVTLERFASEVQPMLANRCGRCHSHSTDVQWSLMLPPLGSRPSARMTHENLMATLKYISHEAPLESELRIRALDGHAGPRNALGARDAVAISALENWLQIAKPFGTPLSLAKKGLADDDGNDSSIVESIPSDLMPESHQAGKSDEQPETAEIANPFDPEIFNRRMHPPTK